MKAGARFAGPSWVLRVEALGVVELCFREVCVKILLG